MKSFYTKEDNKTLEAIRAALLEDGAVDVHNEYETFYGVGFDKWLRNGLADLDCPFEGQELESLWLWLPMALCNNSQQKQLTNLFTTTQTNFKLWKLPQCNKDLTKS
jgi:hypothetical protein